MHQSVNSGIITHMDVYTQQQGAWVAPGMDFRARVMHEAFGLDLAQDRDQWDRDAWHLVAVVDHAVVGYYRAMCHSELGFCTEFEFDLSPLNIDRGQILEVGRACTDQSHPTALFALWRAVIKLARSLDRRWIMGTASLSVRDYDIGSVTQQWQQKYLYHQDGHAVPRMALPELVPGPQQRPPPLIRTYENLGARIVSDPGWDPRFQTADVVTLLDTTCIPTAWRRKLCVD